MVELKGLDWVQEQGYLTDLTPEEREVLEVAGPAVVEIERHVPLWAAGKYPQPGTIFYSLSLWGSFSQLWRYECGLVVVDRVRDFLNSPVYQLYINDVLVGLSVNGRTVLDLFSDYLTWVGEESDVVNFVF